MATSSRHKREEAEAKASASFFVSMEEFHDSLTKRHEINTLTTAFSDFSPELQGRLVSYIEGENVSNCRHVQACLIGFNWAEYECLGDGRREVFVKEFAQRYQEWAKSMRNNLNNKLKEFKHKQLRFEFFLLPFKDVEAFRTWFKEELSGVR